MERSRGPLATVFIVVGFVLTVVAVPAFYVREEILERRALENRLAAAVESDQVREVVAVQIVDGLVDAGATDLLAVRPILVPAVRSFLGTKPFQRVVRIAAADAYDVLIEGKDQSLVLDLGQGTIVLVRALGSVSPDIAELVPENVDPKVLEVPEDSPALTTVRNLRDLREEGAWLPLFAILAFGLGVAVARRRRQALAWSAASVALAGGILVLGLTIGRAFAIRDAGAELLPDDQAGEAVGAIWDSMLGDLRFWGIAMFVAGVAVAIAAGASLTADQLSARADRITSAVLARPKGPLLRALRGVALIVLGAILALSPDSAGKALIVLAGLGLGTWGVLEASTALEGRITKRRRAHAGYEHTEFRFAALGVACAVIVGASGLAALLVSGERNRVSEAVAEVSKTGECNGSKDLCDLRLSEVTFPATHNSFSAAERPGWTFANQRFGIDRQLSDGIRGFLLDFHLGVKDPSSGKIRTDLRGEEQDRNRVGKAIGPQYLALAERFAGRLGAGDLEGKRDVYMCHSVCELGSEPAVDVLKRFAAFLDKNPGEVLVFYVEPYLPPREIEQTFRRAGLFDEVVELDRDEPLPTLGELTADGTQLVVLAERDGGSLPWYHEGFSFSQDTPLGATKPNQFRCDRKRGDEDSPLFLFNHWIDEFPPRPSPNKPISGKFLRNRLNRCARARDLLPNIIAVDYYDSSGVVDAARALNREASKRSKMDPDAALTVPTSGG